MRPPLFSRLKEISQLGWQRELGALLSPRTLFTTSWVLFTHGAPNGK